jgi:polyribonucleotide nucleotidyltransferase
MIIRESVDFGGKELFIETGRMAKQADGAVLVQYGDSVVIVTAVGSKSERPGIDFLPLTCDYQEHTGAAGRIPGGYFKREGRPTEHETLTSRLIDRPTRPLFPKTWRYDTQVIAIALSADQVNPTDVLGMTGASCALHISDVPWDGPYAGVRVGRIGNDFIVNPTFQQQQESVLNLLVAATRESIVMVECGCKELPEDVMVEALLFAHRSVQPVLDLQEKLRAAIGKPKRSAPVKATYGDLDHFKHRVREIAYNDLKQATAVHQKQERIAAVARVHEQLGKQLAVEFPESVERDAAARGKLTNELYEKLKKEMVREQVLQEGRRIDGRRTFDIRPITCEVGVLPRTHGSALFTRGETQALAVTTLGTKQDAQRIETLLGEVTRTFLLHYNFPPFSTGETKPMRGPARREIGHGKLAERAIAELLPAQEDFPYTIRIVSTVLESNGSSSMATVCGGCLSLMEAGVPIKAPVAGIAMGLIYEGNPGNSRYAILSDILGDEDHLGDMDFKVCGTARGITALQMDIKLPGLEREILAKALYQARDGRMYILDKMLATLPEPRKNLSPYAPRIFTITIKPDRIRDVIGPGGKMIRGIIEQTGVAIDVSDDGRINIASSDEVSAMKAIEIIKGLTEEAVVGNVYAGTVRRVTDFGAFVEILPGTDGLVHISELDWNRVNRVEDVVKEGDEIEVKVTNIDKMGKIRLSRRELLPKPEGYVEPPQGEGGPREGRDRGDRDRGPRRDGGRNGGGARPPRR